MTVLKPFHAVLLLCSLSIGSFCVADENSFETKGLSSAFKWLASMGVSFGGAEAEPLAYDPIDEDVDLGGPMYLGVGADYSFNNNRFSLQTLVASQFDSIDANNGDASLFDRTSVDVLAFYNAGQHRWGVGVTQHFSPHFQTAQPIEGEVTNRFKDSTGFIVEYNYRVSAKITTGARFTFIDYTPNSGSNRSSISGDNMGLFIKSYF